MTPDKDPCRGVMSRPALILTIQSSWAEAQLAGNEDCRAGARSRTYSTAMTKYLIVGVGGCLGSILRFWVAEYVGTRMGARFPYGTFIVNCTACFLIGLSVTILAEKANWSSNWKYLIPIGFIGGYSTFSTFEFETFRVIQEGEFLTAGLNVVLSVVVGFISVWLGVITGRTIA
jgi:fluoride exporter